MEEKTSPLDVDRTPSARLRVERSLSASVRGETAVTLRGYEFSGTLGYGAFARVLKARHIASGEARAVKVIDKAVLRKKKTMRRSGSAIAVSSALDKLEERQTQFRNRTPREKLSKRGSLRGGFAGNSPLARGDGVNTPPSLEKAPSETISELATLQSENATPPP